MMDIKWKHLEATLDRFADRVIELARENLTSNGTNASNELYNSMEKIIEIGEDHYSVKISLADYYEYVERGRGPGKFPPPPAIRKWVEIKPVSPYPGADGRIPSVDQLTFLIGRKIAREGTEPQPFLTPAKEEALREFEEAIDKAIQEDVEDYIMEVVEEKFKKSFT